MLLFKQDVYVETLLFFIHHNYRCLSNHFLFACTNKFKKLVVKQAINNINNVFSLSAFYRLLNIFFLSLYLRKRENREGLFYNIVPFEITTLQEFFP